MQNFILNKLRHFNNIIRFYAYKEIIHKKIKPQLNNQHTKQCLKNFWIANYCFCIDDVRDCGTITKNIVKFISSPVINFNFYLAIHLKHIYIYWILYAFKIKLWCTQFSYMKIKIIYWFRWLGGKIIQEILYQPLYLIEFVKENIWNVPSSDSTPPNLDIANELVKKILHK